MYVCFVTSFLHSFEHSFFQGIENFVLHEGDTFVGVQVAQLVNFCQHHELLRGRGEYVRTCVRAVCFSWTYKLLYFPTVQLVMGK